MATYTETKKQIEKIRKELIKLQNLKYERWQSGGSFTTDAARYASEQMDNIKTALQGLEMVLV